GDWPASGGRGTGSAPPGAGRRRSSGNDFGSRPAAKAWRYRSRGPRNRKLPRSVRAPAEAPTSVDKPQPEAWLLPAMDRVWMPLQVACERSLLTRRSSPSHCTLRPACGELPQPGGLHKLPHRPREHATEGGRRNGTTNG